MIKIKNHPLSRVVKAIAVIVVVLVQIDKKIRNLKNHLLAKYLKKR